MGISDADRVTHFNAYANKKCSPARPQRHTEAGDQAVAPTVDRRRMYRGQSHIQMAKLPQSDHNVASLPCSYTNVVEYDIFVHMCRFPSLVSRSPDIPKSPLFSDNDPLYPHLSAGTNPASSPAKTLFGRSTSLPSHFEFLVGNRFKLPLTGSRPPKRSHMDALSERFLQRAAGLPPERS